MLKKTTITVEKFDSNNKEFLTRLEDSFDDLNETIDTLMQISTDYAYDIEKLNTVVNTNSVDIDALKEKIYVKSNDINNLHNGVENLNNKVRIVEKATGINMKDIDGILDKSDIHTQDIKNLNEAISRLEKQQYEIMKSINRIDALEEGCKHNLHGLDAINRRVEKLAVDNHLIQDLHDDITKLNNTIYDLNIRVSSLERKILTKEEKS